MGFNILSHENKEKIYSQEHGILKHFLISFHVV